MTFACSGCGNEIGLAPGGRPNVRSQVLSHLTECLGVLPPAEVVDHLTERAMLRIKKPPLQCLQCDDICTIHGDDDNIALCSDLPE